MRKSFVALILLLGVHTAGCDDNTPAAGPVTPSSPYLYTVDSGLPRLVHDKGRECAASFDYRWDDTIEMIAQKLMSVRILEITNIKTARDMIAAAYTTNVSESDEPLVKVEKIKARGRFYDTPFTTNQALWVRDNVLYC